MTQPDFPMPIITPRLLIRPPAVDDYTALNEAILASWDLLHQFMDWAKEKPSLNESKTVVKEAILNWKLKKTEEPWLPLFIFDKQTGDFIGAAGYHHYNWDVPCLESGYWIRSNCSGKGFMTEAINALTQYAFKQLNVRRMAITCDIDNFRSRKIPERLNYVLEGVLKANRLKPVSGEVSDTMVFAKYSLNDLPSLAVCWDDDNFTTSVTP